MNECSENECKDRIYETPIKVPRMPLDEVFIDPTNVASKQDVADAKEEFNKAIEEIKASPDVVDVVADKGALDKYETDGLTDKDIVKVLKDEKEGGATSYYRWDGTKFELDGTLDKYTVESITSDKGTSRIENHADGGVMTMVTKNNKWGGLCVNDGDDVLAEAYAVNGSDKKGSRIILNTEGAYYTKQKNGTTVVKEKDELVVKSQLDTKVDKDLTSDKGTARIFNESDGGAIQFKDKNGNISAVCVNDGTNKVFAEMYALKESENKGSRIILDTDGAYYTNTNGLEHNKETDEIATVKTVKDAIEAFTTPKTLTASNICNTPGTFLFKVDGCNQKDAAHPVANCDFVGIQMAHGNDAFQVIGTNQKVDGKGSQYGLWFRACDGAAVSTNTQDKDWSSWDRMIVGTEFDELVKRVTALESKNGAGAEASSGSQQASPES